MHAFSRSAAAVLVVLLAFLLSGCEPWQQSELVGLGRTDDGRLVAQFTGCGEGKLTEVRIGEGADPDSPVLIRLTANDPPVGVYIEVGLDPVDDRFSISGPAPGSLSVPIYIQPRYGRGYGSYGSFDRLPERGESLWLDSVERRIASHPFEQFAERQIQCVK